MKIKAEEKTLSRSRIALPTVFRQPFRTYVFNPSNPNWPYGIQKIEFEGDPDVPMISHEDFRDREFATTH